jgi:hypothetical protein
VHHYATELLVKIWENLGLWCLSGNFFVPHRQNMTPQYQNSPHVMTLAFDSKLDIKLLQTLALD